MEIEPAQPTGKGAADRFTGDVWVDPITATRLAPLRLSAGIVRFAPGAHTAWHVHALGHTLHVTDGIALVQARNGRAVAVHPVRPTRRLPAMALARRDRRDLHDPPRPVRIPPDDEDRSVTWGDHVTDDYRAAHHATAE